MGGGRFLMARTSRLSLQRKDCSRRLGKLATIARERLKPLADPDYIITPTYFLDRKIMRPMEAMGNDDGAAILLLVAKLDVDGDGSIDGEELQDFLERGEAYCDKWSSTITNYAIILALNLTIFISLVVLSVGDNPYASIDNRFDDRLANAEFSMAAGDAADYFFSSTDDPASSAEWARYIEYILECICVNIGMVMSMFGMVMSIPLLKALGTLPDTITKFEIVIKEQKRLKQMNDCIVGSVIFLMAGICAISFRVSAIMFICSNISSFLIAALIFSQVLGGASCTIWRVIQGEVKILFEGRSDVVPSTSDDQARLMVPSAV